MYPICPDIDLNTNNKCRCVSVNSDLECVVGNIIGLIITKSITSFAQHLKPGLIAYAFSVCVFNVSIL